MANPPVPFPSEQAAFALFSASQNENDNKSKLDELHLQIGNTLLQHADLESNPNTIFNIVSNLNLGSSLITDFGELLKLAQLNLRASIQAKKAIDYSNALQLATIACDILFEKLEKKLQQESGSSVWAGEETKGLASQICIEREILEYALKNTEKGNEFFETICKHVTDDSIIAQAYFFKCNQLETDQKLLEAFALEQEFLGKNEKSLYYLSSLMATEQENQELYQKIKKWVAFTRITRKKISFKTSFSIYFDFN